MHTRFICPHCHAPVDPRMMELARSDQAEYRICPACDEAVPVAGRQALSEPATPGPDALRAPAACPIDVRAVP